MNKWLIFGLVALISFSIASAWMDPPTDTEKENFQIALKNMTVKEFGGIGVTLGAEDMQTSIYIYSRHSLINWTQTFKDAFSMGYPTWTEIYAYVLEQISLSDYYETYGYFNINNQTYWINNINYDNSILTADLTSQDTPVGTIELHPLFWSFWTGQISIDGDSHKAIILKFRS